MSFLLLLLNKIRIFWQICLAQLEEPWNVTEVTGNYVYANNGLQWVGYDNENTMRAKVGLFFRSSLFHPFKVYPVTNLLIFYLHKEKIDRRTTTTTTVRHAKSQL